MRKFVPQSALATAAVAVVLAVGFAAGGCARRASAEPLQVTYYYLPG